MITSSKQNWEEGSKDPAMRLTRIFQAALTDAELHNIEPTTDYIIDYIDDTYDVLVWPPKAAEGYIELATRLNHAQK